MSPPEEVSGRAHAIAVEDICNDYGNSALSGFNSSGASFAHVDGRMAVPPLRPSLLISLSRTFSFCGVSQSGPCRQPRCSRR